MNNIQHVDKAYSVFVLLGALISMHEGKHLSSLLIMRVNK